MDPKDVLIKVLVSRDMFRVVDESSQAREMAMSAWVREAIGEKRDREQAARLDAAQ
jgi:hypothetical protein